MNEPKYSSKELYKNESNYLDKELIRLNDMDTDVVREILIEMDSEDIPRPNYASMRNEIFIKKRKPIYNKRMVLTFSTIAVVLLSACTVLAVRYIPIFYEWIIEGNTSTIYTDQITRYDTIQEAIDHVGIEIKVPTIFPDGYVLKDVRRTDWEQFKDLTVRYEKNGEVLTLIVVYEYKSISDVKFMPYDVAVGTNYKINGIDLMYHYRDGWTSSVWEIDGVLYLLVGNYTKGELDDMIASIKL